MRKIMTPWRFKVCVWGTFIGTSSAILINSKDVVSSGLALFAIYLIYISTYVRVKEI